jgi:4-amino-4-deoxy-L-arabinose transferase-like glycosyltransferase
VPLLLVAVFAPMALVRLADGDEGAYLFAAKLVAEGKRPYFDFSYPQMPLLPYLYGAWMTLFGASWWSGRALSAIFAVALGLAVFRHVRSELGRYDLANVAAILFAFSGLGFAWYPIVHSFVFPTLMLFVAMTLCERRTSTWAWLASGLALGLAVDTRFYVLVALPTLVLVTLRREPGRVAVRRLGAMTAGLAAALVPALAFFVASPDTFLFNVVRHHALRSTASGPIGEFGQKATTVMTMLGLGGSDGATTLQFTILFVATLALVGARLVCRERLPASASIAVLLLLVSLLPSPTYPQYACMALPFMAVSAVALIADVRAAVVPHPEIARRLRPAALLLLAGYVAVSAVDFHRYVASPSVTSSRTVEDWRIGTINTVAKAVDDLTADGDRVVITWWPGYLIESRASILPRTENHFNLWYSAKLTPAEVQRYKYMTIDELIGHIRSHRARTVVLGNWVFGNDRNAYRQILTDSGYVVVKQIGDASIYRWNGMTVPARN